MILQKLFINAGMIVIMPAFIACTLICTDIHAQHTKLLIICQNVKGPIESMSLMSYELSTDNSDNGQRDSIINDLYYCTYYDNNRVKKIVRFTSDSLKMEAYDVKYDKNGNILLINLVSYVRDFNLQFIYNYDDDNNLTEEKKLGLFNKNIKEKADLKSDGVILGGHWIYDYNELGNLIKKHRIDTYDRLNDTSVHTKEVYIYNDASQKVEKLEYNKSSEPVRKTTYIYDRYSNLITKYRYNKPNDSEAVWTEIRTYNDQNKIDTVTRLLTDGTLYWENTYRYDEQGNLVEKIKFGPYREIELIKRYNKRGHMIECIYYNEKGEVTSEERSIYTYDEYGNIVKRKIISNGHKKIISREIHFKSGNE